MELSTGAFHVASSTLMHLASQLSRLTPSELLVPKSGASNSYIRGISKDYVVSLRKDDGATSADSAKLFDYMRSITLEPFDEVRPMPP